MPDISFPVSLPRFTDDEYEIKKAAYVAENGYFVSPPRLGDIIHLGFHSEPDDREWEEFKTRRLIKSNPHRHAQIQDMLSKKRERVNRMLASPMPTWGNNIASVLTFFDDINDTLGSMAVVGRIAARLLPKLLGRLMLGPVGWLLLAADIAGLVLDITRLPFACIANKRRYESVRDMNPFSKNAKVRRARKLRRVLPGKGEMIEMLQTTDNIFGIGLCLGPILGFGYDIVAGTVRTVMGQKVTWRSPPPRKTSLEHKQQRALRFAQVMHLAKDEMTEDEHLAMMLALNGATQILKPYIDLWHPLDQVEGLEYALLEAPKPIYATTKEILLEYGVDPDQGIGWPGLDKSHAGIEELWDTSQATAADGFFDFAKRNRNSYVGACGCQNGYEFGTNMLLILEGYETVQEEMTPAWSGWYGFFTGGCELHDVLGIGRGGCTDAKSHIVEIGGTRLMISGCAHGITDYERWPEERNILLHSRDCKVIITPDFCPEGYRVWVNSIGRAF